MSIYIKKSSVVEAKFAIGRGFPSACGQTDDSGRGDAVIWYVSTWHAVYQRK